jgi:hypothetical protein
VTPDQYLRTSVQKSCFVLSHSACVVLDISLRKYRVGHADLIPGGGIAQLKPAVLSVVARLRHGLSAAGNCFLSIRFAAAQRTGLRSSPIEERKSKLAALLQRPPADVRYSASFTQNIDELLSRVRELSLEGLISKRVGSKYGTPVHSAVQWEQTLPWPQCPSWPSFNIDSSKYSNKKSDNLKYLKESGLRTDTIALLRRWL